jgi:dihydroorotate dehydrogenase electron transfer subunit
MTAPFGRRICVLAEKRRLGPYVVLAIEDATDPRPGQFYMLSTVDEWGGGAGERPYLPRAISALSARDGRIEFLLEDVGPGTHRLCELEPGEQVYVTGPFGNGFTPDPDREAILVGGGVGIPPLAFFQERHGGNALLGFRDAHHAEAAVLFSNPEIATDDGSRGHHGYVTELLAQRLNDRDEVAIFSCGPPPMLDAVQRRVTRDGVPSQLALEAPMACGFGACFGCVVETTDGYKRVCVDGPVFDAALLA